MADGADPRISAIHDYVDALRDALDAAATPEAKLAISDQMLGATRLSQAIIRQQMAQDDAALAAAGAAITAQTQLISDFKAKLDAYVRDVGIAAEIVGTIAKLAHLIPGL